MGNHLCILKCMFAFEVKSYMAMHGRNFSGLGGRSRLHTKISIFPSAFVLIERLININLSNNSLRNFRSQVLFASEVDPVCCD